MATVSRWERVGVATYSTDEATLAISDNELSIITDEGSDVRVVGWTFPDTVAVCRRVTVEVPDAVAMPRLALEAMIQWYEQGANDVEQAEVDAVRAWLSGLSSQGANDGTP